MIYLYGFGLYLAVGILVAILLPESGASAYLRKRLSVRINPDSFSFLVKLGLCFTWPIMLFGRLRPRSPRFRTTKFLCSCGGYYVTSRGLIKYAKIAGILIAKCKGCQKFLELPPDVDLVPSPEDKREKL